MRGEIWTLRDDGYASKSRPVIVLQGYLENEFDSIILCLCTTYESAHLPTRVRLLPDAQNGLRCVSYAMTEKLLTVDKKMLGNKIGKLSDEQMHEINKQIARLLLITAEDL
jgi:mRNA interferase MazF